MMWTSSYSSPSCLVMAQAHCGSWESNCVRSVKSRTFSCWVTRRVKFRSEVSQCSLGVTEQTESLGNNAKITKLFRNALTQVYVAWSAGGKNDPVRIWWAASNRLIVTWPTTEYRRVRLVSMVFIHQP